MAIADAIEKCLKDSLGNTLAEVFVDKSSLRAGVDYPAQLEKQLEQTHVLIVAYTGVEKPSHGFTGYEIGFYRGVQAKSSLKNDQLRLIVPMFLDSPPDTVSTKQGFGFNIKKDTLQGSEEDYRKILNTTVGKEHPAVRFLEAMQDIVEEIRKAGDFPKADRVDASDCVKDMLLRVFRYLKTTVEETIRPQKKLLIQTENAAVSSDGQLPKNANICPEGGGGLNIFGLPETEIPWETFCAKVQDHKFGPSWRDAIATVVASSICPQTDIDNNQIVVSHDERSAYRIILTADARYYDGRREFSLYFVETLRPKDFGNRETTLLLKGLEIVCRFRFMYLEEFSEFAGRTLLLLNLDQFVDEAKKLLRELNLLRRDAQAAGLDKPNVWGALVDWEIITKMSNTWRPFDDELRSLVSEVLAARRGEEPKETVGKLRKRMVELLASIEASIRPLNGELIGQMIAKFQILIKDEQSLRTKTEDKQTTRKGTITTSM